VLRTCHRLTRVLNFRFQEIDYPECVENRMPPSTALWRCNNRIVAKVQVHYSRLYCRKTQLYKEM
jgi:hypothetical protein